MEINIRTIQVLQQLQNVIKQLNDEQYTNSLDVFSGAHIGQHCRHILEFYSCLLIGANEVSYDNRERKAHLETSVLAASELINKIIGSLETQVSDRPMILLAEVGTKDSEKVKAFDTSLNRELLYLFEHSVHHMAIIKIGLLLNFPNIEIPTNFGVADSTIRFRENKCAQ